MWSKTSTDRRCFISVSTVAAVLMGVSALLMSAPASGAQGAAQTKSLAILAANPDLAPLSALVQAKLTQKGLSFVERGELDKVLQEQELSAGGLAGPETLVKLGSLIRADGFLLLSVEEASPTKAAPPRTMPAPEPAEENLPGQEGGEAKASAKPEKLLRIRVIETAHAVRLLDWFAGWSPEKGEEVAEQVAAKVLEVAPKLRLPAGQLLPVGIVDVHRVQLGEEYQWACRTFAMMLAARLSKEPRIVVLEREDLRRMQEEKLLTQGKEAEFWRSGVLIEGYMQRSGKEGIDLKLQVRRAGGQELPVPTIPVDLNKLAEGVEKSAKGVVEQATAAPLAATWDPAREAEEFFRQGEWLRNHDRYEAALPQLETAFALAPSNVRYGSELLAVMTPLRGLRKLDPASADLELAELASKVLALVQAAPAETQEQRNELRTATERLLQYMKSWCSVANERVMSMNRDTRRKVVEQYHRRLRPSPGSEAGLLVPVAASTPGEAVTNMRDAINKLVMPPGLGGEAKSDVERCLACYDIVQSLRSYLPEHLWDAAYTYPKGMTAYLRELANAQDPIARLTATLGIISFSEAVQTWLPEGRTVPASTHSQTIRAIAESVDRDVYSERALAAFNEIDLSGLPQAKREALQIMVIRVGLRFIKPIGKRVAAYEECFARLVKENDVQGILSLAGVQEILGPPPASSTGSGVQVMGFAASLDWIPPKDFRPGTDDETTRAAGEYVRTLRKLEAVVGTRADDQKVLACIRSLKHGADPIEGAFWERLHALQRWLAEYGGQVEPGQLYLVRHEVAVILEAFPGMAAEPKDKGFSVRMLLRTEDWPQPWSFVKEDFLHCRAVSQDGMLWVAFADIFMAAPGLKPKVGLAGFDMKDGRLVALWQAPSKGVLRGLQPLSGVAIGAKKSYVAIEGIGLVEFPGYSARGKAFIESPRILTEKNGLPPGHIVGIAPLGEKLWIGYAWEGSGLGIYDPQAEKWETVFCSDVRGETPFEKGETYELREFTAVPGGLMFVGGDGFWRIDAATRELRRLSGIWGPVTVVTGWGQEHWFADYALLGHLVPDSAKVELLLEDANEGPRRFETRAPVPTAWSVVQNPFVPPATQAKLTFLFCNFGGFDLLTAAVHGDEVWARYGASQLIVLRRSKPLEDATIMVNDILEGKKVLNFYETPYGLIAVGVDSVGLIEALPTGGALGGPGASETQRRPQQVTFNSQVGFDVYAMIEGQYRLLGRTPSERPLTIPPCWYWFVKPRRPVDMEKVRQDLEAQGTPGLDLVGTATDADLEHLKGLTALRVLDLRNTRVTDRGLEQLKGVTSLQRLFLDHTRITDAGLEHLKGLTSLQSLELPYTRVTDEGMEYLKGLTALEGLGLDGTQVTDAGVERLKGLKALRNLGFGHTRITDSALQHLKGMTVQKLTLSYTRITDAGLEQVKGFPGVRILDLPGTQVTDAGLEHLKGLTVLHTLDLTGTQVTDAGLERLKVLTTLQTLALAGTKITGAGLQNLKGLTVLRSLNLAQTEVTDAGMQNLRDLTTLEDLDLTGTQVTDAGLQHLKGLAALQELDLEGTGVTDSGLTELTGLKALDTLDLVDTKVTDAGLDHLRGMTGLRHLYVRGSKVTAAGVERLKRSLPDLVVAQ